MPFVPIRSFLPSMIAQFLKESLVQRCNRFWPNQVWVFLFLQLKTLRQDYVFSDTRVVSTASSYSSYWCFFPWRSYCRDWECCSNPNWLLSAGLQQILNSSCLWIQKLSILAYTLVFIEIYFGFSSPIIFIPLTAFTHQNQCTLAFIWSKDWPLQVCF